MSDVESVIIFLGGICLFVAALFYGREVLRFRASNREWAQKLFPDSSLTIDERIRATDAYRHYSKAEAADEVDVLMARLFELEQQLSGNDALAREELVQLHERLARTLRQVS